MAAIEYVLCVLDKIFPPMHSFVDGMLCEAYPVKTGKRVILMVERNTRFPSVVRYKGVISLNVLPRRRGIGRLLGPFMTMYYTWKIIRRMQRRNKARLSVLVRNDPMFLIGILPLRRWVSGLVYQSSFPHEVSSRFNFKASTARLLLRKSLRFVDGCLAVSEGGVERLKKYAPNKIAFAVVPLAVDNGILRIKKTFGPVGKILRVIYVGTHAPERRIEVVLEGCAKAFAAGIPLEIRFVGGTREQIADLLEHEHVMYLVERGVLTFFETLPRPQVFEHLEWAHIGLSLIPPSGKYKEASPTKLAEYLGAGVVCLASKGIPMQEEIIEQSGAGYLVEFESERIARALSKLWESADKIPDMQKRARAFAEQEFRYTKYVAVVDEMLWGNQT